MLLCPPYFMEAVRAVRPHPIHVNHVFMLTATKICASWQISAMMTPFLSDVITSPPISWWPGMWCPRPLHVTLLNHVFILTATKICASWQISAMMTPFLSDVITFPLSPSGQGCDAPPPTCYSSEPCLHTDSYKDMCQLADLSNDDSIPFWCHYIPPYLMVARDVMPCPLHVTLLNHVFILTATKICASWQISAMMTPFLSDAITFPPISWWPGMWCPAPYMLLFWTMSSYWQLQRYVPVGRSQQWWLHSSLMSLHSPLSHGGQGCDAPPPTCYSSEPCLHTDSYKDMCQLADLSNDDSIPFWCHYIPPYLMVARDVMPHPLHVTLLNHVFILTATKICASWQISAMMTPFLSDVITFPLSPSGQGCDAPPPTCYSSEPCLHTDSYKDMCQLADLSNDDSILSDVITFPPISWWPGMWCPAPYMLLFWTMSSYWQLQRYVPVGRSQQWWLHSFLMPLHSPLSPSGQGCDAPPPTCYSSEPCLHTDSYKDMCQLADLSNDDSIPFWCHYIPPYLLVAIRAVRPCPLHVTLLNHTDSWRDKSVVITQWWLHSFLPPIYIPPTSWLTSGDPALPPYTLLWWTMSSYWQL